MKYELLPCTGEDIEFITNQISECNNAAAAPEVEEDYILLKVEDDNKLIGGCIVAIDRWNVADLDILWVDENYRRQGIGSAVISEAERIAREKGCHTITLGTFDFQARPLYEKHGFTVCGTLDNCPKGHDHYDMIKYLDKPFEKYIPSKASDCEIKPASEEEAEIIDDNLCEYNNSQVPYEHDFVSFEKKILNADGKLIAGCLAGLIGWNNAFIDAIWVDENYRGQKIGSDLLYEIERELKEKGAYMIIADALDQNADFYLKNGYTLYGKLEDCPKDHTTYKLQKRF